MNKYRQFFKDNGYLIIPSFIHENNVQFYRQEALKQLSIDGEATLRPTLFLQSLPLSQVIFSNAIKSIIGELSENYRYFLPNFTIRNNLYIGWHSDDEFVDNDTHDLPQVVQCNIYLQDNSREHGGGIDVYTGTHTLTKSKKKSLIENDQLLATTIQTKAGDLFLFDYRVLHRSTPPIHGPLVESRLAIQWTMCNSEQSSLSFTNYFLRRQRELLHLSDFTDKRATQYFLDVPNVTFPHSFLPETLKNIQRNNFSIFTPLKTNAA